MRCRSLARRSKTSYGADGRAWSSGERVASDLLLDEAKRAGAAAFDDDAYIERRRSSRDVGKGRGRDMATGEVLVVVRSEGESRREGREG